MPDEPVQPRAEITSLLQHETEERITLRGDEIARISDVFAAKELMHPGDSVAVGSSIAARILLAQQSAFENNTPFYLSDLSLNIGDIDFVHTGDYLSEYIAKLKAHESLWKKPLELIDPQQNDEQLKHYPLTKFHRGVLVSEGVEVPVEFFSEFTYGGKTEDGKESPIFTAKFLSSKCVHITDDQGISINCLGADALAIQSWIYGRENKNDFERAKEMIDLYLKNDGNDIFTLLESVNYMCPYKAVDFSVFLFDYIEERGLEKEVLSNYFGEKSEYAYRLTREMVANLNPEEFPYHNFFSHILTSVRLAKSLLKQSLVNPKYAEDFMLAIYAHESGLNVEEGRAGHEERGSKKLDNGNAIAAELIRITKLAPDDAARKKDPSAYRPAIFVDSLFNESLENLKNLQVPEDDAKELLYGIGLVDVANIYMRGQLYQSFNLLKEEFVHDKKADMDMTDYVVRKGLFFRNLFENIRSDTRAKLAKDEIFRSSFYSFFVSVNRIDSTDIAMSEFSTMDYINNELNIILQEKIDLWNFICADDDIQFLIQQRYLESQLTVGDPRERTRLRVDFNRFISKLYATMYLVNNGLSSSE